MRMAGGSFSTRFPLSMSESFKRVRSSRSSVRSSAGNSAKGIVELVQDLQRIKKTRRLEDELLQDQEIRAELREIERKIFWCQRVLAFMTMGSLMLAVLINEICAGNDYADEEPSAEHQAFLEDPDRSERDCVSTLASTAKLAQSALTLCLLLMIVSRFGLRGQQTSVLQRLRDRQVSVFKPRQAYAQRWPGVIPLLYRAGELGVCAVHTLPWFYRDFSNEAMGRRLFYRSESLLCGFMFLRLYHVYLWLEQSVFLTYFDLEDSYLLKDVKTIQLTLECDTSHTVLAFKVAMTRNPLKIILLMVALLLGSTTYIVRIAEGPAGQAHSKYLWNQMWVTFTQGRALKYCTRRSACH